MSMLPEVVDPRFRVHDSAIERWHWEVWATAYKYSVSFLGTRRVQKDALMPQEIVREWQKITGAAVEELAQEGGQLAP